MNAQKVRSLLRFSCGFIVFLSLSACATNALKSEWREKRGYSEEEMNAIRTQSADYYLEFREAKLASTKANSQPLNRVEDRFVKVFCSCQKKLGEKCRQKPVGLSGADKELWAKANAIDWVLLTEADPFSLKPNRVIDPAECP